MSFTLAYFYEQTKYKYSLSLLTKGVSLQRKITWVHMVEDPENSAFLRGGELIVTTGLEIGSEDDLIHFIQKVYDSKACGLIINCGSYINDIPETVVHWCMKQGFPLFSMPWEVHIADLMQDYCNEIISEKRVSEIRSDLLKTALNNDMTEEEQNLWDSLHIHYIAVSDQAISISAVASVYWEHLYFYALEETPQEEWSSSLSQKIHVGLSEMIAKGKSLKDYKVQAVHALLYGKRKQCAPVYFENLGLYHMALLCQDHNSIEWAERILAPIQEENLRKTFLSYLEHNGSVAEVAKALFLHRNTVNYRLQKIRSLLPAFDGIKQAEYILAFYILEMRQFD